MSDRTQPAARRRRVLITGATRGIGAAIAQAFERESAELILTGTRREEIDALNAAAPVGRRYLVADFGDPASVDALQRTIDGLDSLDVLVNNAGINIIRPVTETVDDEFDLVTAINYRAPYLLSRAAARKMTAQGSGWIVNIGSIWSVITKAGRSQYCASKAGLAGMTRAIATDVAPSGVMVNCVSPGFTLTDLTRESLSDDELAALAAQIPVGRMADPDEIARVVYFLASAANTYLTGQNIVVDGGFSNV